jgi:hypothetical protein
MRNLLAIVTGVAVILGVVSTSLWRDLRNERALFAEARAASRVPVRPPTAAVAATASVPAVVAPPACMPTAATPTVGVTPVDGRLVAQNSITERDLLKDPEYRKARLASRRLDMQRSNPGVAEALGLSEKDADRFFDLLAENQIRMNELPAINARDMNPQTAAEESIRNRQALEKQQNESLVALLGNGGFAQWQEYQQTRGARSKAISMGSQLQQMGLPLTNAQLKPLTAALIAEELLYRQEQPLPRTPSMDAQERAALQEETQRRNDEANRRVLAAIAPSLNPQQLAVFREQFESQEAMNRITWRARERALAARGQ